MGKDWRDNKFGLESAYSALNESEDFWFSLKGWLLILLVVALVLVAGWWLLTWLL